MQHTQIMSLMTDVSWQTNEKHAAL